jgi:hypothetical protein
MRLVNIALPLWLSVANWLIPMVLLTGITRRSASAALP